jgi:hypothetical protein
VEQGGGAKPEGEAEPATAWVLFFWIVLRTHALGSLLHVCCAWQVLRHVWQVAARAVPAVRRARYVEWWAHSRQHCYGHQIHFDSVPGRRSGAPPRHPIISTVLFLSTDCGAMDRRMMGGVGEAQSLP